jgi:hypothetical protein
VQVNELEIDTGDAIAATDIGTLKIKAKDDSEMVIFDLV